MRFPITSKGQQDLGDPSLTIIRITPENISAYRSAPDRGLRHPGTNPPPHASGYSYRVGAGDKLTITFYADPMRVTDAGDLTPRSSPVIDEMGEFFYPFVGKVRAGGRTVGQIRDDLTARLAEFFATPQIEVAVQEFNARRVTITGAVDAPGQRPLTNVPITLLDLVNEVGAKEAADLSRINLRRGNKHHNVDLHAFLDRAQSRQNPILLPGDLVQVPIREDNKVFTFGEIAVGEYEVTEARKTLIEILAEAGGLDRLRADARGIFVFRRDAPERTGFDIYQFDLSNAAALILAADFEIAPLDIVFVTNDPATRWSDTINKIVQPFDGLLRARTTGETLGSDSLAGNG